MKSNKKSSTDSRLNTLIESGIELLSFLHFERNERKEKGSDLMSDAIIL